MADKDKTRRHGVFVRLNDAENGRLQFLQEQEYLPKATLIRRLLFKEALATRPAAKPVGGK